ncbi:MAG: hypothetical protein OEZ02_05870 [Anaerolineae bacterium]|nr:hypothetical protein [Anaerolineae bacterium]
MNLFKYLYLFGANIAWRATGFRPAGRPLLNNINSPDENLKTIAGMFLVQAGKKAEPLLREALQTSQNLPMLLTIIGDIGAQQFAPDAESLRDSSDPHVAEAARYALKAIARRNSQ